jgi:hypothetical protein
LHLDPFCCECGLIATEVDHLDGTDYPDHSGEGKSWLNIHMARSIAHIIMRNDLLNRAPQDAANARHYGLIMNRPRVVDHDPVLMAKGFLGLP